jgi:hypothetical protein
MATRKRNRYRRGADQVPTIRVTTAWIMSSPAFELRLSDARRGIPFDWRVGGADTNAAWNYERGRSFASLAPLNMPLRIDGKLNPKAIAVYDTASKRGWIA